MTNSEWVTFELDGFLKNAGILGLVRVLEYLDAKKGSDYDYDEDVLRVQREYLLSIDLAKGFLDTSNALYYKGSHLEQFDKNWALIQYESEKLSNESKANTEVSVTDVVTDTSFETKSGEDSDAVAENRALKNFKRAIEWLPTSIFFLTTMTKSYLFLKENYGCRLNEIHQSLQEREKLVKAKKAVALSQDEKIKLYCDVTKELENKEVRRHLQGISVGHKFLSKFYKNVFYIKESQGTISILGDSNLEESFRSTITLHFENYLNPNQKQKFKKNWICASCHDERVREKGISLTNMRDMLKDARKKSSVFWDFDERRSCLCDKCGLLYLFAPLGFNNLQQQAYFVNANHSIELLIKMNEQNSFEDLSDLSYTRLFNRLQSEVLSKQLFTLSNMQLIVRDFEVNKYRFNVVSRDILEDIKLFEDSRILSKYSPLHALSEMGVVKMSNGFFNVYDAVVLNIFNHHSHYPLLQKLMRESIVLKNEKLEKAARHVLHIQLIKNHIRRVNPVTDRYFYTMKSRAEACGSNMNQRLAEVRKSPDSVAHRLLNALRLNDKERFRDLVYHLHISNKVEIDSIVVNGLASDESFKDVGYAYVGGLTKIVKHYQRPMTKDTTENQAKQGEDK